MNTFCKGVVQGCGIVVGAAIAVVLLVAGAQTAAFFLFGF